MEAIPGNVEEIATGTPREVQAEKPGKLFLYTLGWVCVAEIMGALVAFVDGFTKTAITHGPGIPSYVSFPATVLLTQTTFLFVALHRGRLLAKGRSVASALGYVPISREWPIIVPALIIILWDGLLAAARFANPPPVPSSYAIDMYSALATGGWVSTTLTAILVVIVGPVAEELFFRGWLWEGLRRHWTAASTMFGTAIPWLLVHAIDDVRPVFIILPQAVCISLVRHFCGSVRASMALHILNNLIVAGCEIWFFNGPS